MFLDLKHLRALAALGTTGSMARAAERLHLTPSALSHQIKALEAYFGTELLVRRRQPLQFTPAGERLLALGATVLPEVSRAERDLQRLAHGAAGRLHIALECHSCFDWLLPTMHAYRRRWPEVELDLSMAHTFEPLAALESGEVDLVITADPRPAQALEFHPLFRYEVLLAMPAGHPLAGRRSIAPHELGAETLITYPVERERLDVFTRFLNPAGIAPAAVRTSELTVMILQLVASGRGVAALPNWALSAALRTGELVARPLGENGIWAVLHGACRRADADLPYVEAFLATARETSFATLHGIRPA